MNFCSQNRGFSFWFRRKQVVNALMLLVQPTWKRGQGQLVNQQSSAVPPPSEKPPHCEGRDTQSLSLGPSSRKSPAATTLPGFQ